MTGVFDAGLQPERTALAWRRTCLAFLVASGVSMRVLPDRLGAVGYLGAALTLIASATLFSIAHFQNQGCLENSKGRGRVAASGLLLACCAALLLIFACFAAAVVFLEAYA